MAAAAIQRKSYRAIWISDVHLGIRQSRTEALTHFLDHHDAEQIYLVGDILDGLRLKKRWHWDGPHHEVIQRLLAKVRNGSRVYYIPGNHDAFMRRYAGCQIQGIHILQMAFHKALNGKRYLVIHGDEFDRHHNYSKFAHALGAGLYEIIYRLEHAVNVLLSMGSRRTISMCGWLKKNFQKVSHFIGKYEAYIARYARERGMDGVICGHIHHANMQTIDGVQYYNTGDWVESCTALVEDHDANMKLVDWSEKKAIRRSSAPTLEFEPQFEGAWAG